MNESYVFFLKDFIKEYSVSCMRQLLNLITELKCHQLSQTHWEAYSLRPICMRSYTVHAMQSPAKAITHFATTLLMKPNASRNSKFNTHGNKNTTCTTKCTYTLNSSNITKNIWLCASQQNHARLNSFVHWTMGLTSLWKALRGLNNYSARYQKNYSIFHCDGSKRDD